MRAATEIVRRVLALDAARFRLALDEQEHDAALLVAAQASLQQRIGVELARGDVADTERAWAATPIGSLDQYDHLNISWLTECEAVLLWALGQLELPPHDCKVDLDAVDASIPLPGQPIDDFMALGTARGREEVQRALDLYEIVLWRLRAPPQLDAGGHAPTIREAFDKAGVDLLQGDLPIDGEPAFVHDGDGLSWVTCRSIATERLRALRWLLSDTPWDELSTDVRWPGAAAPAATPEPGELDIKKLVTDVGGGQFHVRTDTLRERRHPEIEIGPIPFVAVPAAAKLIDYVIDAVVGRGKQLKPGENVGVPLSIAGHEDVPAIFVGVHATELEPPAGFFAKLFGSKKGGALRLVDLFGNRSEPPYEALATVMHYRANCRLVTGDMTGALGELRASIELMPGDPSAGPPPDVETGDAELNWQNHLSYLRLAELVAEGERAEAYGVAFSRFGWLAKRELGCMPAELALVDEAVLVEDAARILRTNRESPGIAAGPHAGLRVVASPLWVDGSNGVVVREASLIPTGFVDYYFGEHLAAAEVAAAAARLAARCVSAKASRPWEVADLAARARDLYAGAIPTNVQVGVTYRPWHFLLSAVLAEVARHLYAGATIEELEEAWGIASPDPAIAASLQAKMSALEGRETDAYTAAILGPS